MSEEKERSVAKKLPSLGRESEELKRTARILELVLMIASAPQRYSRRQLAERFAVSERMITKDLEIIRHGLKLPLPHSSGGYYFEKTPSLPALQYNFSEALALLTAVQAALQVSGAATAELAVAMARLEALFPPEFAPLLRQMRKPPPMTAQREHRQQMLSLLNRALLYRNKVQIVYETRSREGAISERIVHPYQIMPYVRSWQLIAWCERRQEVIMFKIDRIHQATILPELRYEPVAEFDPEDYIGNRWGIMRVAGEPEAIELHFDGEVGRRVAEEEWHRSQQTEILPDGRVIFRLHLIITPEFVNWLLYYGHGLEVVAPGWLRERVAEEHRQAWERYR
jgi:predicted DNA-binding transcriptional regulator YafY